MAVPELPLFVDTVVVGGGPSSLLLSYILHGHIPHYKRQHFDPILHRKISNLPNLLHVTPDVYSHFAASLKYSTQALPINTLLDTLVRPNADTEIDPESCVEWRLEPARAVSHVVLTDADQPGGQWSYDGVGADDDISTLSYSEMLALPGYSYAQHFERMTGNVAEPFERPSRKQVAGYFASYAAEVGIQRSIFTQTRVRRIERCRSCGGHSGRNFRVVLDNGRKIKCAHLILGTGIFTTPIPPPQLLQPLLTLPSDAQHYSTRPSVQHVQSKGMTRTAPLLVIGSGFSAADAIVSTPKSTPIIHVFRWSPETRPSPLKGCHNQAYPEYAGVYRRMKAAVLASGNALGRTISIDASAHKSRKPTKFERLRDWEKDYEGLANAEIIDVQRVSKSRSTAIIQIRLHDGEVIEREVFGLRYLVGRRGTLNYLSDPLRREVLQPTSESPTTPNWAVPRLKCLRDASPLQCKTPPTPDDLISSRTLRAKCEESLQLAPNVWAIGSLTGDSLIRHAYGGCVYAAAGIFGISSHSSRRASPTLRSELSISEDGSDASTDSVGTDVEGQGHDRRTGQNISNGVIGQHDDLHLDRREVLRSPGRVQHGS